MDSPVTVPFPIVGIGASAGGLEAFKEMLRALSRDAGMAYVFVQHMPPRHESMLSEILSRVSPLPLTEVKDGMTVEPNHVYVLPAGCDIDLRNGGVHLTPRREEPGHHRPIDHLFHSLAEHLGHKAIGVVLSGTASDGALGIQQIKAAGGITFAQDGTAQQNSMPRSAIQTGSVDFVLRPEDISRELSRIAAHPMVAAPAEPDIAEFPDLMPVIDVLQESTGVDFTHYKHSTLYRRISRRIVLHKLSGLADYVSMLRANPGEVKALYQDILINVTSFFRNPEAFDALKQDVFPALTLDRSRHDPVRIWTLGCSTGEEAYSLAIAFAEYAEQIGRSIPIQVFATDLNAASIDKARAGFYLRSAVTEVSAERLRRFFVELDGGYRIAKPIRDACIFARHNVLDDPPFSRIDLVSCRNMLIYLGAELQQKVIPVLHYALRPNGFLWLGTSETIGAYRDLFSLANTKYKIYAKKGAGMPAPPGMGAHEPRARQAAGTPASLPALEVKPFDAQKEVDRILLTRFAPPGVLVREDLEILQYRGNTSPYLAPAPGRASLNLLKMLREGLALGVRSAVQRAVAEEVPVRQEGLVVPSNGSERRVNIEVIPIKSGVRRADTFLVLFEDVVQPAASNAAAGIAGEGTPDAQETAQLRQELTATREYLQSVIEQQEAANEELQSANEEVQSANEELQSINEELETSKEEVQSSNEELATVNDELHGRNAELAQTNNDLSNLLSSVQMAIVMLGPNLRIRRFTPMAEKLLNVIPSDIGRPVSDIKMNLEVPDLESLIAEAVDKVEVREREIQDRQGHWYSLRVRPYRTLDNKVDGAVLIWVEIDALKRSQQMWQQQTLLLGQVHEPIIMWKLDGDINYWNKAARETYGFTSEEAVGRKAHELLLANPSYETFAEALRRYGNWSGELEYARRDGLKLIVESSMVVVADAEGGELVVEADRVITQRKQSERVLRDRADTLIAADRHKDEFLAMLAHELRNPLAPLRNLVAVLQSGLADLDQKGRALDIMDRQIHNMARLIDDLLDVSRITLSQIELRKAPVDAAATVRRVAEQHESAAQGRQQKLHVQVPDEPLFVDADEVRLEQIIGNLLNNASKYTPAGGDIWITVENAERAPGQVADHAGEDVLIRVRDNGIGIEADKLDRVFDLFMRATRSIDQRYGGLGVGLTLVRRLVELHGGRVEALSDGPGKGSEFVVALPLIRLDSEFSQPGTVDSIPKATTPRRVLVVDDSPDILESTAMSLRMAGHDVEVADSGARALEIVELFQPEVVLVDIGMPGMDGYEVAKRLHASAHDGLRLIALSGYGQAEARQRAMDAGFKDYLVKPASLHEIQQAIDKSA